MERSRRGATVVISVVAHAVAGLAAVGYSFWHIEEVTPARVTVTFVSAAALPVPPPPPPPLASGGTPASAPKHRPVARPKTDPTPVLVPDKPKPTPVVDTSSKVPVIEAPHEAPAGDSHAKVGDGEVTGSGQGNGKGPQGPGTAPCTTPNCAATGVPGGTASPKFLPPQIGLKLKLSGPDPDFPAFLRQRAGTNYMVLAKICVTASGAVSAVTLLKRAEPTLDNNVMSQVKAWRFQPMTANGTPAPFCYVQRFEFKSE